MKKAWIGTSVAIVTLAVLNPGRAQTWEHYPGLNEPGANGILVGDYDGNGRNEAVIANASGAATIVALLDANATGQQAIRNISVLPFRVGGRIVPAPQENGADRFAALVYDMFEDTSTHVAIVGGIPPRVLRMIDVPRSNNLVAIANVGGDGRNVIVVANSSSAPRTFMIDYETGEVEWTSSYEASALGIAQLDDDPGLELILGGYYGTPGRIVDGATRELEWSYPAGFRSTLVTGTFFADTSVRGFALAGLDLVQLFRSGPYSPVSEFEVVGRARSVATVSLDSNGVDYIAIGSVDEGRVDLYDPRTGARVLSFADGDGRVRPGVASIATGDLAGDGSKQIVFNTGMGANGKRQLRAVDLATQAVKFVQDAEYGPYSAVARGDVAGNGGDQVVYVTWMSDPASIVFDGQMLRVLDAADGHVLRERALTTSYSFSSLALAQLDSDPQLEIVLVSGGYSEIAVLDGLTLRDQWRLTSTALNHAPMAALAMIDIDGDGADDLVTMSNGLLHAFNGRTGARLWQPLSVSGFGPMSLVAFRQASGVPGAIVANGYELRVVDLRRRTQVVHVIAAQEARGLSRWGDGEACKVGVLDEHSELTIRRCADLGAEAVRRLPPATLFFRPIDPDATRFIAAATSSTGSELYEVGAHDEIVPLFAHLGYEAGYGNFGVADVDADGCHVDVVLGSDYMVTRRRFELDHLFADGFD